MSAVNSNWMFASRKNNNVLFLQTEDEYKFCHFLEFDTRIQSYISQPPRIMYHIDQESHEYTADFFAYTFSDGEWYFEVKTDSFDINAHKSDKEKYGSIEYDLKKQGFNFLIIDEFLEKNRVLYQNMLQFKSYRKSDIDEQYMNLFKNIFSGYEGNFVRLKELLKIACRLTGNEPEVVNYHAYTLISKGIIEFDVHKMFSTNMYVRFADEGNTNIWNAVSL